MPAAADFISYAANREDVVLWRTLAHVPAGTYLELCAAPATGCSVTRALYDHGWSGTAVIPDQRLADTHRAERPRDTVVEAAAPTGSVAAALAACAARSSEIHLAVVGSDEDAQQTLAELGLTTFRPWVLVVRATRRSTAVQTHDGWEADVLAAGYDFCLFDGVSRFYVAHEHAEALARRLAYPACVLDAFTEAGTVAAESERLELVADLRRWRAEALGWWAQTGEVEAVRRLHDLERQLAFAANELTALRATLSWKVTRPIRAVRRLGSR